MPFMRALVALLAIVAIVVCVFLALSAGDDVRAADERAMNAACSMGDKPAYAANCAQKRMDFLKKHSAN